MRAFNAVLNVIRHNRKFLVTTHHNPDADALSSALAMASIFKKFRASRFMCSMKTRVLNGLNFCPAHLHVLKKRVTLRGLDYDAAIVLDCGDLKRVGGVRN